MPTTVPTVTPQPGGKYHNKVGVVAVDEYQQVAEDSAGLNITVLPMPPKVSIEKRLVTTGTVYIGSEVTFRIAISNTGLSVLKDIDVIDTYDASILEFASSSITPDELTDGSLIWANVGPLEVGETVVIEVSFTAVGVTK